jgi:hypothetical protein
MTDKSKYGPRKATHAFLDPNPTMTYNSAGNPHTIRSYDMLCTPINETWSGKIRIIVFGRGRGWRVLKDRPVVKRIIIVDKDQIRPLYENEIFGKL